MMLCLYSQGGSKKPNHGSFGEKIRDKSNPHAGVDLFAPVGSDVYAAVNGKVTRVHTSTSMAGKTIGIQVTDKEGFWNSRDDNYQVIYKNDGEIISGEKFSKDKKLFITYMHLSEMLVKVGDVVKAGQLIGKSGVTGENGQPFKTANPHLHFAIGNLDYSPLIQACNPMLWITPKYENSLSVDDKALQEEYLKKYLDKHKAKG
ncbi:M23 family metallopeptidase [Aliivibrio fischeri]|nr:M23 family metallopeptidase [Aliivibrio fischeri]